MARASYFDVYKNVRNVLNSSGKNVKDFCNLVSQLSLSRPKRLALNSSDSMFEGVDLPGSLKSVKGVDPFLVASTLVKVPTSVFELKAARGESNSAKLPSLLENTLRGLNLSSGTYGTINSTLEELRKTTQFLSDNNLHDNYGQLRPFVIEFLKKYQEVLLKDTELKRLKKLSYCLTLLDAFKTHSIDSDKLFHKIVDLIKEDPEVVKRLPLENFFHLSKVNLPLECSQVVNKHIRSMAFEDLSTVIKYLPIVLTRFDDKRVMETFLCAVSHKMKLQKCTREDLLALLRSLKLASKRHNDEDLTNLKNSLLELIYPKVSQMFLFADQSAPAPGPSPADGKVAENTELVFPDNSEILLIFECYMGMFKRDVFMKNCHEGLVNYMLENKEAFTPTDLVDIIDQLKNSSSTMHSTKILVKNEYFDMGDVNNELVRHLLSQLGALEFNDLCHFLYSLSLPNYFKLHKILYTYPVPTHRMFVATGEEEGLKLRIMEIAKRRITNAMDEGANNKMYSKYIANTMLYKDFDLNHYFDPEIKNILMSLSTNNIINILTTNTNDSDLNQEVLNRLLSNMSWNLDTMKLDDLVTLLDRNKLVRRNSDFFNKLFSVLTYKLISTKNGYIQLLQSTRHLTTEIDPQLVNMILQYMSRYLSHLSIYDVELLLGCMTRHDLVNDSLLLLLNHAHDMNLSNAPNNVLLNVFRYLNVLKIRHEPLIKKFTDRLLNNFRNEMNTNFADLISLTESLSALSMPYNDLYVYLTNYLEANAAPTPGRREPLPGLGSRDGRLRNFHLLGPDQKVDLLHAISNFGIVDQNFKVLYLSLLDQLYPHHEPESEQASPGAASESAASPEPQRHALGLQLPDDRLLKLYEVHLDLVLNNVYNDEADSANARLKQSSSLWFARQEMKSHNFKKSNTYMTIKDSLDKLGVKHESGVTEVYFCNFIISDRARPTVLHVIPPEDVLRFWTTGLDAKVLTQNSDLTIGSSQKTIRNLKMLGYDVLELHQARWDSLQSQRTTYLEKLLQSS